MKLEIELGNGNRPIHKLGAESVKHGAVHTFIQFNKRGP